MGGGNREQRQAQQTYNTTLNETKAESPYERRRREINEQILNFAESGDYRNPQGVMKIFTNFAEAGNQKRLSDLNANTRGQGVSALGAGANPELLALNKQHRDDVNAQNAAGKYQESLANVVGGAASELGDLQGADTAKKLGILSTTAGVYGQQSQIAARPKWWQSIIGAGGQVGAGAAQGFAGSALGSAKIAGFLKDGGRVDKYIGRRVLTGEEGPEMLVDDEGNAEPLGVDGPEVVVPQRPGVVIPNDELPFTFNRRPDGVSPLGRAVNDALDAPRRDRVMRTTTAGAPQQQQQPAPVDAPTGGAPMTRPRTMAVAPPAPAAGVEFDETQSATRPRINDVPAHLEGKIADTQQNPAKDKNGWFKSILKAGGTNALLGFMRGGLPGAVGGGIAGAVAGAVDRSTDERMSQGRDVQRWQEQLVGARAGEKARLDREDQRATTDVKKSQAAYYRQRPEIEAGKREAAAAQRERTLVKANLGALKGQKLDPSNPRHAAFLDRAERAGYFIDANEWNRAGGNLVSITTVDPSNPQQTRQQFFNKTTGELTDVAQKGYVQPVKASGMTEAQERGDADRDASRADTNARFEKMFGLGVQRFEETVKRGLTADAARTFGVEVRGQFERARAIEKEIADLERRKAENLIRKGEADERIGRLRDEATGLGAQVEAARSKALGGSTRAAPSSSGGGARTTEAEIRRRASAMGKNVEAAVKAARDAGMIQD